VSAGSVGVDRARTECCVFGAQNQMPVCDYSSYQFRFFSKSTVEYADIIVTLCTGSKIGEYPGT
jgi:hypothetical protein